MSIKHTPGPWCADFGPTGHPYYYIAAGAVPRDDADVIATVRANTKVGPGGEEARANARLIAAAPELLDTLRELLDSMDANGSCQYEMLRAACRDAIARAEGGAA